MCLQRSRPYTDGNNIISCYSTANLSYSMKPFVFCLQLLSYASALVDVLQAVDLYGLSSSCDDANYMFEIPVTVGYCSYSRAGKNVAGSGIDVQTVPPLPVNLTNCGSNQTEVEQTKEALQIVTEIHVSCRSATLSMCSFQSVLLHTPSLESVNISGCNLEHIPANTFQHLLRMEILDLSFNRLSFLSLNLSGNGKLKRLYVNDNALSGIAFDTVDQLNKRGDELKLRIGANRLYCCNMIQDGVSFVLWMKTTSCVVEDKVTCLQNEGNVVAWNDMIGKCVVDQKYLLQFLNHSRDSARMRFRYHYRLVNHNRCVFCQTKKGVESRRDGDSVDMWRRTSLKEFHRIPHMTAI